MARCRLSDLQADLQGREEGELALRSPPRRRSLARDLRAPLRTELRRPDRPALRPAESPALHAVRVLPGRLAQRLGIVSLGDRGYHVRDGLRSLVRVTRELTLDRGHRACGFVTRINATNTTRTTHATNTKRAIGLGKRTRSRFS